MGKIILILSCMFSGKTETLISYARRYTLAKKRIVIIKYSKDIRYSNEDICSHNRASIKATFSVDRLEPLLNNDEIKNTDVVLIDEGQFFNDLSEVCDILAKDKIVIVAGLNGDYKREPFKTISDILPKCEEIIHLKAVCSRCGDDAHFTKRLINDDRVEVIGGSDLYEPRCRNCF